MRDAKLGKWAAGLAVVGALGLGALTVGAVAVANSAGAQAGTAVSGQSGVVATVLQVSDLIQSEFTWG